MPVSANRSCRAGTLPLDLRRDALGLQQPALRAADEPESALSRLQDLVRRAPDIDRIVAIWRECLAEHGGPFLFGVTPCLADAMYAPVVARFVTYDVKLDFRLRGLLQVRHGDAEMQEWLKSAMNEPEELEELDVEF